MKDIKSISIPSDGNWIKNVQFRKENRDWLRISSNFVLTLLDRIDELGMDQDEAINEINKLLNVPDNVKIFKGSYDFKISEIAKIEKYLDFKYINNGTI